MKKKASRTDLLYHSLNQGDAPDLSKEPEQHLSFDNLDLDDLKPKGSQVEYASVKIKTELYTEIKKAARAHGIKQPGKFISKILELYLQQAKGSE